MPWCILALRLSGLGFYIAICIVGGIALGVWLDNVFNTRVIFMLIGLLVGCTSAFYGTYRMVTPLLGDIDSHEKSGNGRRG